jgi:hypothetical protein
VVPEKRDFGLKKGAFFRIQFEIGSIKGAADFVDIDQMLAKAG